MPRLKISELTQTTSPIGTDVFPIVSGGSTKKVKLTTISDFIVPNAQSTIQPLLDLKANLNGDNITASTFRTALGATATGTSVFTAASAAAARTAIGAVIGTDVQAYDADLGAIAALTSAADKMPYSTGAQTWALADLSSFARTLLAGANQAAFLAALGQIDSVELDFVQAGTGAVTTTVQAKLREAPVLPEEFGAFTNATTTTATLLAAFTAAMSDGRTIELSGSYSINGPITPTTAVDGAELHIIIRDDVTITVDSGATAFNRVLYAESTTAKSHTIGGPGTLTINCNNKAAAGLWLRHTEAATGGSVIITCHVHVKNVFAATGYSNAVGIIVAGRYERIVMHSPTVEDVSRFDGPGAESSGITCTGFDGEVELYSPVVRRVYYGSLGTGDADCIKCFGRQSGTTNGRREGSVRMYSPVLEDGQVRLYKDQCGDTIITSPWCRRRAVDGTAGSFATSSSVDFDFQFGGGLVLDAHIEYYKSATGATPLGASHTVFAFQQLVDDSEMYASASNSTIISDVSIPRVALLSESGATSVTSIDGLTMIPANGFTETMLTRGTMEFDASQVGVKATSAVEIGTATSGGASTLTDSSQAWTVDQWAGYGLWIASGTGAGQSRTIASNTATELTVTTAWSTNPDATSVYRIAHAGSTTLSVENVRGPTTSPCIAYTGYAALDTGTATAGAATTLTDSGKAWTTNQWGSYEVRISSGTGSGQARTVSSNTATVLTVTPAWGTNPDATSVYTLAYSLSGTSSGTATAGAATTLTAAGETWTPNQWVGRQVRIDSGTGVTQTRTIASNTATVLTVTTAWTTNPDATSTFTISGPGLTFRVNGCSTTMAATGQATRAISEISGNQIVRFDAFEIGMNPGFRNYYSGWNFDVRKLRAGTTLVVATAANLVTNAPSWGVGADNGVIECIGLSNYSTTSSDTICRAFVNNATTATSYWVTQDGGLNWGALN